MKWEPQYIQKKLFANSFTNQEEKLIVAKKIAQYAKNGDVIGFGSGSTSYLTILEIYKRITSEELSIKAIPTSKEIALVCEELNIPITSLNCDRPDWCFDGADEVDEDNNLIKGRGGAMFNEKLNIINSNLNYILIDSTKEVTKLGEKFPIPVEVSQQSLTYATEQLYKIGATNVTLRLAQGKDGPIITENNNFILDAKFVGIEKDLEKKIKLIPGVIESGLFIGYNVTIIRSK